MSHTASAGLDQEPEESPSRLSFRDVVDRLFEKLSLGFGLVVVVLIAWIGIRLFADSGLTRGRYGAAFLTDSVWDVPHELYGALPFIFGTIVSSLLALVIAVPLGVGAALFLSELAPKKLANPISFVIELLAAVPSIIYGLWGFLVLCPFLQTHVSPWIAAQLGANPLFAGPPVLTNMLAAGVILAIMILPIIASISKEVLQTVPRGQREAALGLGATRWEAVWQVVLPEARAGIAGAVILGLGRALGETMAVVMVIGNTPKISASILQSGYTMPALLANQFNEAYNDLLQRSALLEIALILFGITVLVNALARLILLITARRIAQGGVLADLKPPTPARRALKVVRSVVSKGALPCVLALQFYFDLRAHGVQALWMPFELVCFLVLAGVMVFRVLRTGVLKERVRPLTNLLMQGVMSLTAAAACFVLGALLVYVFIQGVKGLGLNLFTQLPRPPGMAGGGMKNAIVGTLMLIGIASAVAIPLGILGGIYVAQFGKSRLKDAIRFSADVLNGIPSVVIGLFAYAAFVIPFGHFSAWAGGAALAIIMIPTVLRTTEEMIRLVPDHYLEGALSLGSSRSFAVRSVVLPPARSGIVTGVMLAIARAAGETAPLLFTAFGSDQLVTHPSQPVSSLTMKIYQYAVSPYDDWVSQAWAAALLLMAFTLVLSLLARIVVSRRRLA